MNNRKNLGLMESSTPRLVDEIAVELPSSMSGANGTERSVVIGYTEGQAFIYGGPIDKQSIERYSTIEINSVPACMSNGEMVRLLQKCIFRTPFSGISFLTFSEIMASPLTLAGYMIENSRS